MSHSVILESVEAAKRVPPGDQAKRTTALLPLISLVTRFRVAASHTVSAPLLSPTANSDPLGSHSIAVISPS